MTYRVMRIDGAWTAARVVANFVNRQEAEMEAASQERAKRATARIRKGALRPMTTAEVDRLLMLPKEQRAEETVFVGREEYDTSEFRAMKLDGLWSVVYVAVRMATEDEAKEKAERLDRVARVNEAVMREEARRLREGRAADPAAFTRH